MVQIHSPRPLLLEPAIYRLTNSRGAPGPGPGGRWFKSIRPHHYFPSQFNTLRCVFYCDFWPGLGYNRYN
jgi:hypothetical protein